MNGSPPIIMRLKTFAGRPAVIFNDGDVFFQDGALSQFLMHLSILIPEEWDALEIRKHPDCPALKQPEAKGQ